MEKTSFKQKILLIILGVFLSLFFLEVGLRMAGGIVLYLQERHNHASFSKDEYRILCLGESTTALGGEDSYPSQLEQMLNGQNRQMKFTVINEGIISTTSNYILTHLDQNLEKYKPQMVIVMMGINDKAYLRDPYKSLWWENIKSNLQGLKVYKLAHLLYAHISHRIKEISAPAQTNDLSLTEGNYQQVEDFLKSVISQCVQAFHEHMSKSLQERKNQQMAQADQEMQFARRSMIEAGLACVELARRYRLQGFYAEAQNILEQATLINPNFAEIYMEWGELFLAQKKGDQAQKAFQTALGFDPKNNDALQGLARAYHQEHNDNAFLVYIAYLQIKPRDYWGHIELARWFVESKHYDLAQRYLSQAIEFAPDFDQAYIDMGQILEDQRQYQKEEAFYLKEISFHPENPRLTQALGQFYRKPGEGKSGQESISKGQPNGRLQSITLLPWSIIALF